MSDETKGIIVYGLLFLMVALAIVLPYIIVGILSVEKDRERCMNMPFSEMIKDESCQVYMEALDG